MSTNLLPCKDGLYGIKDSMFTQECGCKGEKFIAGNRWPQCYQNKIYIQTYKPFHFSSIGDCGKHEFRKYGNRGTHDADSMVYSSVEFECGCYFQHWDFTKEVGGSQMGWNKTVFVKQDDTFCVIHEFIH